MSEVREQTEPAVHIPFANRYARLPEHFHARVNPRSVSAPTLIALNEPLARFLNIDPAQLRTTAGVEILAGNRIADGSEPTAIAYAGHQFGSFNPTLGDGRANLLGEVIAQDGKHYDIQLKGSGPTPFSRRGDGRAALGPVLREYILSESMHTLGVPTTRALAAVLTGDKVIRESIQPGGIVTRIASSHLRIGTFQYFAARGDNEAVRTLAHFAIDRHYPEVKGAAKPISAFLAAVVVRQARLVAKWMDLGFIHGVMNTDNTSISGETIDYGPCAFMEQYHPNTVFSSIDHQGRYAYQNQPAIITWNLSRLAEALLPLLAEEEGSKEAALEAAYAALNPFQEAFETAHVNGLRRKLGLTREDPNDLGLAADLLQRMAENNADFTLTFRRLANALEQNNNSIVSSLFTNEQAFEEWATQWRARLATEDQSTTQQAAAIRATNPIYIPRNHLVQQVIDAGLNNDFAPFHKLNEVLTNPYEERPGLEQYATPARPEQRVTETFCGT